MSLALRVTRTAPSSNEQELVAAVRRGDDRAFEELYARYKSRIGSYIFGMVGDHGRAEDIAQEVFISALRRLRATDRPIIFKPWIYEIAKNACIDEFRRTRRIHEVPLETDDERESSAGRLPSSTPTPDAAVESKQRLTDLRGAFRGLSESHHRILVLRELEGLSYHQIGSRMGMSKPVVESTLFRARRRLGEEFEEIESGRRCERVQGLIAASAQRPLRSLGVRERRQFARHVGHCEPCLRQAREAGVDESLYKAPKLGRLAVLAPISWLRIGQGRPDEAAQITGPHHASVINTLRTVVPYVDPSRPGFGFGRAITAAAIVAAGAGASGGLVSDMTGHAFRPPHAVLAGPLPPVDAAPNSAPTAASVATRGRSASGVVSAARAHRVNPAASGSLSASAALAGGLPLGLQISSAPTTRRSMPGVAAGSAGRAGRISHRQPGSGISTGTAGLGILGTSGSGPQGGESPPPSGSPQSSGSPQPSGPSPPTGGSIPAGSGSGSDGALGIVQRGLGSVPATLGSPLQPAGGSTLPGLPPRGGSSPAASGSSAGQSPSGSGQTSATSTGTAASASSQSSVSSSAGQAGSSAGS